MGTADVIVVMGVSAAGKTTIGRAIARETGWDFVEADTLHTPNADEDQWLRSVGLWIDGHEASGRSAVVVCSSLQRGQRDILREGRPHVRFCHVTADQEQLRQRIATGQGDSARLAADLAVLESLGRDEHGVTVASEADDDRALLRALAALGIDPGHS